MNAIPKGRNRDKGVLIQSLCKLGDDEALTYIAFEDLFNSQLLFVTKNGLVKLVSGVEFETNRSMINSTRKISCINRLFFAEIFPLPAFSY